MNILKKELRLGEIKGIVYFDFDFYIFFCEN